MAVLPELVEAFGFAVGKAAGFEADDFLATAVAIDLLEGSAEPGLLPRVPSGPERDRNWSDIGDDALETLGQDRDAEARFSARTEQVRREGNGKPVAEEPVQGTLL